MEFRPIYSHLQDTVQMHFVKASHFIDRRSPAVSSTQQGAIWDSPGQLIASPFPLKGPLESSRITLGNVDYFMLQEPSAVLDWTHAFLLPTSEFFAPSTTHG